MRRRKLGYPLYIELIFFSLTVIAPIIIAAIELHEVRDTYIKISMASIGAVLTAFIVVRKFFLKNYFDKLNQKIILLEHDYSILNGDQEQILLQWKFYSKILYIFNAAQIILGALLITIFVNALTAGLMAFKGAVLLILLFVCAGMLFKFIYLIVKKA